MVVHGGKSTRDMLRRTRQELSLAGGKIFGVVLNNMTSGNEAYYRYSGYSDFEPKAKAHGN